MSRITFFEEKLPEMKERLQELRTILDVPLDLEYNIRRDISKEIKSLQDLIRKFEAIIWYDTPIKNSLNTITLREFIERVGYCKEIRDLFYYYYNRPVHY
jgi:hypothetical protein